MDIQDRKRAEMRVVKAVADAAFADGRAVAVMYEPGDNPEVIATDWATLEPHLFQCDEEWVVIFDGPQTERDEPRTIGQIMLVWGNDTDVIADYSLSVERYVDAGMDEAMRIDLERDRQLESE